MLLALSVIVSLFGVVNTLVLTIYERTREIGMLRAIGASKSQIRRMVRYESLITAMIGAIIGAVIGLLVAIAAVEALKDDGLVLGIPVVGIIIVLIVVRHRRCARRDLAGPPGLEDRGHGSPPVRVAADAG